MDRIAAAVHAHESFQAVVGNRALSPNVNFSENDPVRITGPQNTKTNAVISASSERR